MNQSVSVVIMSGAVLCSSIYGCSDEAGDDSPSNTSTTTNTSSNSTDSTSSSTEEKEVQEFTGSITEDTTLTSDYDYLMKGIVFVESGATLTIEAGTRIMGEKVSLATLVIEPGARIVAEGTADEPIVFTSQAEDGDRAPGDWGGIVLLGNAPINVSGGKAQVEGVTGDGTEYGGNDEDDDSGVLKYVRIEFSGVQLSADNEINGLTLAGVGAGTTIDYVMVQQTLDDCFEFFGGSVNAKHLVCSYNGDDGFDWDFGYHGKLQFLALQQDPSVADDTNGFEGDNDGDASINEPLSNPTIYNATLCGKNVDVDKQQYGMLLRRSTQGELANIVVTGFEACVDIRDSATVVEWEGGICYGNIEQNIAYDETDVNPDNKSNPDYDDDNGLDEVEWFEGGDGNSETDPKITNCFSNEDPDFRPESTLTDGAVAPPNDGFFDDSAAYIGAFTSEENWLSGEWATFHSN